MNPYHAIKKIFLIIILFLCLKNTAFAIDTNAVKFFPLKVGNIYTYQKSAFSSSSGGSSAKYKARILRDSLINNKKYFFLDNFPEKYNDIWVRLDSSSGCLFQYNPSNNCPRYPYEKLLDSFNVHIGDSVRNCNNIFIKKFAYETNGMLFGIYTKTFHFDITYSFGITTQSFSWDFTTNIGFSKWTSSHNTHGFFGSESHTVKGCILNGIVYGDTSTVDVKIISTQVPASFKLHQNYPNPFNPVTKIKFDVPNNSGLVALKVYDFMGREVGNLFEGNLNAGSYEAEWNANTFTSGVYFCRMVSENVVLTKKMLLVK